MDTEKHDEPKSKIDQLVSHIVRAVAKARIETESEIQGYRVSANEGYLEKIEQEMKPLLSPLLQSAMNSESLPDSYRDLLARLSEPENSWNPLLQIPAFIGALLAILPALGQVEVRQFVQDLNTENQNVPLSPADASDAVVRNLLSRDDAAGFAAQFGIPGDVFDVMIGLTGEPPGPMDMLSLWRRGVITQDFLEQAIRYSRVKNEYIPAILELAHSYMTPAEAIELAVKGIIPVEQAKEMFTIAGGIEGQFTMLYEASGKSIGAVEAMNLWNHGLLTEAQVDEVLGRSRINPIFYPIAKLQRHKWLQVFQIEAMIKAGIVKDDDAKRWLLEDGYPADQVDAFIHAGKASAVAKPKGETESMVLQQYSDLLLTETEAMDALKSIGYNTHVATVLLATEDAKRSHAQNGAAISKVRAAMLAGHITELQASSDLDALGVPAAARDQWLKAWVVEQGTQLKTFTMSQVGSFAKKGIISYTYAADKWRSMGYSDQDVLILRADYGDPTVATPIL